MNSKTSKIVGMFDLKQIRRTSFIALLAMIMLALAPTVSKLITTNRLNVNLVEVCTTEGSKWLSISDLVQASSVNNDHVPASINDHGECYYCNLQTSNFLPSVVNPCITSKSAAILPPLFYQAPKPLFAWTHSRSRAPPIVS